MKDIAEIQAALKAADYDVMANFVCKGRQGVRQFTTYTNYQHLVLVQEFENGRAELWAVLGDLTLIPQRTTHVIRKAE